MDDVKNNKLKDLIGLVDEQIEVYTKHLKYLRTSIAISREGQKLFQQFAQLDNSDFEEMEELHTFNSLLTISLLDLLVVSKNLINAKSEWEKAFFLKQGYLIIFETIDTYNKHGKKIKVLITTKYKAFEGDYKKVCQNLKNFKKDYSYEKDITVIRNSLAAHINENFVYYYDTLLKLKGNTGTEAIVSFIKIIKELENISFNIEKESGEYALKQLETEGMGKTLKEIGNNMLNKITALKDLYESKISSENLL